MGHVKDSNDLQSGGGVAAARRALKRNSLETQWSGVCQRRLNLSFPAVISRVSSSREVSACLCLSKLLLVYALSRLDAGRGRHVPHT